MAERERPGSQGSSAEQREHHELRDLRGHEHREQLVRPSGSRSRAASYNSNGDDDIDGMAATVAMYQKITNESRAEPDHLHPHHYYEPVIQRGHSASILRDEAGNLAYPSMVPPAVEPPFSGDGEAETEMTSASADPSIDASAAKTANTTKELEAGRAVAAPRRSSEPPRPWSVGQATPAPQPSDSSGQRKHSSIVSLHSKSSMISSSSGVDPMSRGDALHAGTRVHRSATMPTLSADLLDGDEFDLLQNLQHHSTVNWNMIDGDSDDENGPVAAFFTRGAGMSIRRGLEEHKRKMQEKSRKRQSKQQKKKAQQETGIERNERDDVNDQAFRRDGRVPISVKDTNHKGYLAKAIGAAVDKMSTVRKEHHCAEHGHGSSGPSGLRPHSIFVPGKNHGSSDHEPNQEQPPTPTLAEAAEAGADMSSARKMTDRIHKKNQNRPCPRLNIVIMVIGSRGDIQPFLKIGQVLREKYGHRVRVATHPAFRDFIEKDVGLEFFSIGGDPAELMAFMVKNPGMIPSLKTVQSGDIGRRQAAMDEMFQGFWRACIEATDDQTDVRNMKNMGDKKPFVADAIIANPPSFVHTHCAEALGIPLHLMFTFPYTPTQAFPHPLAIVKQTDIEVGYTNFMSYPLIDMMVWQGLGDLVNNLRIQTLGLDPVSKLWAPGAAYRMHVPFTYLWSPGLVPKPGDWGPEIDISGFVFLELASSFQPSSALEAFLAASPEPPVYIGFGSIVVDDADRFTEMIFEAVRKAGVRALVSKGWGGFGGSGKNGDGKVPDNVFLLGNTPHDWLFPQVQACVIHGGAGTTAIALKCGLPTMVVPFFGDQYFWGGMMEKSGAGPKPVPYKQLTADRLADGIRYCLTDAAKAAAQGLATHIAAEGDGALNACRSFHRTLRSEGALDGMRCAIFPNRMAVWQSKQYGFKLSTEAADLLVSRRFVSYSKLRLLRNTEWNDFDGPGEPVTAIVGSLSKTIKEGLTREPFRIARAQWHRKKQQLEAEARRDQRRRVRPSDLEANAGPTEYADWDDNDDAESTSRMRNNTIALLSAIGHGGGKSLKTLALAPLDMFYAVCQGFHNAPRLYGDDTVRQMPRVTGIKSGMRAAGREFVLGFYDGFTGLVRLPLRQYHKGGRHGLVKGMGMGIMGLQLKTMAGCLGLAGYVFKGVLREFEDTGRLASKTVRRARMAQGQREVLALDDKTRRLMADQAASGWETMQALCEEVKRGDRTKGKVQPQPQKKSDGEREKGSEPPASSTHHSRAPPHFLPNRELEAALESAEMAAVALAAVRRGETLESVMGPHKRFFGEIHDHQYDRHRNRQKFPSVSAGAELAVSGEDDSL